MKKLLFFVKNIIIVIICIIFVKHCANIFLADPMGIMAVHGGLLLSAMVLFCSIALTVILFKASALFDAFLKLFQPQYPLNKVIANLKQSEIDELMTDLGLESVSELVELLSFDTVVTERGDVDILSLLPGDLISTDFGKARVLDKPYVAGEDYGYNIFVPAKLENGKRRLLIAESIL